MNNIKKKLNKAKKNYENNPGNATEMHKFYDRIIRLSTNSSDELFARKKPKENWSKYKTEEEYDKSFTDSIIFSNKFTEEQKKSFDVIIFNKSNADGVMSAYIAWDYITNGGSLNTNIKFFGTIPNFQNFGVSKVIKALENNITGKNVFMADLSFNKDTLEFVNKIANFFIFIDNHSAVGIAELPYAYTTDTRSKNFANHAACAATWKFFYPDKKVSYVVQSIDSGDAKLYLSYLPDPDPINLALAVKFVKNQTKPEYNTNPIILFKDLHTFLTDGTSLQALNFLAVLGQIMSRYAENMKLEVASKAVKATLITPDKKEYKITVLNYSQPGLLKRVGKYMASQNPDTDFSVIWFYNYRERQFDVTLTTSHRPGSTVDIIKIAKSFGGSGFKDISRFVLSGQPGDIGKVIKL
jgi:hypothetical protein